MNLSDFTYDLPPELIAQEPLSPREQANLMVVHKKTGTLEHKKIADFPSLLLPTDVLVLNNTKVFRARLSVTIKRKGLADRKGELFLVKPVLLAGYWIAIGKPGKAFSEGAVIEIDPEFMGEVVMNNHDGTFTVAFPFSNEKVIEKANQHGAIPIPPYIKKIPDANEYQTAYAKVTGSVAAPTAGFHLTPALLQQIRDKGVTILEITLHVGLGTFLPIKSDTIESHTMHSEWVEISQETAEYITTAKKEKRRIIAIGTTTTRALEGAMKRQEELGEIEGKDGLEGYTGDINLFITPGFTFKVIDGLLTNFHLPKSTLLLLVSAFAGKETIQHAYQEAVEKKYRFYSFGDAMFIT